MKIKKNRFLAQNAETVCGVLIAMFMLSSVFVAWVDAMPMG